MRASATITIGGKPVIKAADFGVTKKALEEWANQRGTIGDVERVKVSRTPLSDVPYDPEREAPYTFLIEGRDAFLALSGCNAGYGGEGPHGSVRILKEIGIPGVAARAVLEHEFVKYSRHGDQWAWISGA